VLDTADASDAFEIAGRDQVVATGHHPLQDHFRRTDQHFGGGLSQRVGEQHHRGEQKNDQRIDQQQTEVLRLAPRQRREREVNQVLLFLDPGVHGVAVRRVGGNDQRTRWEVFEAERVILERRMQVGLRQMTRVAGLGEQAKVGELQLFNQITHLRHAAGALLTKPGGVSEGGSDQTRGTGEGDQGEMAAASDGHGFRRKLAAAWLQTRFAARIKAPRRAIVRLLPMPTRCASAGRMIREASANPAPSSSEVSSPSSSLQS
jgi:hypothetical protein